jgi:hypothetical protein
MGNTIRTIWTTRPIHVQRDKLQAVAAGAGDSPAPAALRCYTRVNSRTARISRITSKAVAAASGGEEMKHREDV